MIKSLKEIEKMRVAGQLAADTLEMIDHHVKEVFLQENLTISVMILL